MKKIKVNRTKVCFAIAKIAICGKINLGDYMIIEFETLKTTCSKTILTDFDTAESVSICCKNSNELIIHCAERIKYDSNICETVT